MWYYDITDISEKDEVMSVMTLYEEFRFRDMKSRKVGLEEGAKLTQIKNAKAMLADSMPVELVSKYTGLSAEQIENIKTDI